jgi:hypothetical protein
MSTNNECIMAGALAVLLVAGCGSSGHPSADAQPDTTTTPPVAAQDSYFEGSQRVWEAARDRGVVFRAVGQEPGWVLEVREEPCMDTMSGERFSMTATLTLNNTTYDGCGRMLDRLP